MESSHRPTRRFVEVEAVLRNLARWVAQAQQTIDRRSRDLCQELLGLDARGFSLVKNRIVRIPDQAGAATTAAVLPLSSLVSFRRYRITELRVDFAVVPEDGDCDLPGRETRFRVVPLDSQAKNVRLACLRVTAKEPLFAEFQLDGESKGTLALGAD